MIKNYNNEKLTPKQAARDMIMDALDAWLDKDASDLFPDITDKEGKLIWEQQKKESQRIAKRFGYEITR